MTCLLREVTSITLCDYVPSNGAVSNTYPYGENSPYVRNNCAYKICTYLSPSPPEQVIPPSDHSMEKQLLLAIPLK